MMLQKIRQTEPSKFIGIIRLMLGGIFVMTGLMKLMFSDYATAWSIQLIEAEIPLYTLNFWFVPIFEVILGLTLAIGFYSRIGALMVLPLMLVAIYVHLTVFHPGAFPSQPQQPYMPILVLMMTFLVIRNGAGSWSFDGNVS